MTFDDMEYASVLSLITICQHPLFFDIVRFLNHESKQIMSQVSNDLQTAVNCYRRYRTSHRHASIIKCCFIGALHYVTWLDIDTRIQGTTCSVPTDVVRPLEQHTCIVDISGSMKTLVANNMTRLNMSLRIIRAFVRFLASKLDVVRFSVKTFDHEVLTVRSFDHLTNIETIDQTILNIRSRNSTTDTTKVFRDVLKQPTGRHYIITDLEDQMTEELKQLLSEVRTHPLLIVLMLIPEQNLRMRLQQRRFLTQIEGMLQHKCCCCMMTTDECQWADEFGRGYGHAAGQDWHRIRWTTEDSVLHYHVDPTIPHFIPITPGMVRLTNGSVGKLEIYHHGIMVRYEIPALVDHVPRRVALALIRNMIEQHRSDFQSYQMIEHFAASAKQKLRNFRHQIREEYALLIQIWYRAARSRRSRRDSSVESESSDTGSIMEPIEIKVNQPVLFEQPSAVINQSNDTHNQSMLPMPPMLINSGHNLLNPPMLSRQSPFRFPNSTVVTGNNRTSMQCQRENIAFLKQEMIECQTECTHAFDLKHRLTIVLARLRCCAARCHVYSDYRKVFDSFETMLTNVTPMLAMIGNQNRTHMRFHGMNAPGGVPPLHHYRTCGMRSTLPSMPLLERQVSVPMRIASVDIRRHVDKL